MSVSHSLSPTLAESAAAEDDTLPPESAADAPHNPHHTPVAKIPADINQTSDDRTKTQSTDAQLADTLDTADTAQSVKSPAKAIPVKKPSTAKSSDSTDATTATDTSADTTGNTLPSETSAGTSGETTAEKTGSVPQDALPATLDSLQTDETHVPEYVVIRPSDEVTYSSEISASVLQVNVKEGSDFVRGDVLLQMDCRVQEAELEKALSQQQLSKAAIESAKKLKSYNSISQFEFAQAIAQERSADADVRKLLAIVDKCTIRAPFTGSVSRLMVRAGETVRPGDPLLKIISTENLDFQMQVPSDWLEWLRVGMSFSVHINELDRNVQVTIVRINPEIDPVSQTVRIIAKTSEVDPSLRPGMSGQAKFPR